SPDNEVEPERRLPDDLRDRQQTLRSRLAVVDAEQRTACGDGRQRAAGQAEQREAPRDETGAGHQGAEDAAVADPRAEPGPEQKRPLVERDKRPAGDSERSGIRAGAGEILAQGQDREHADDARDDDRRLEDARGDVAEREALAVALADGIESHGRADVA